MSTLANACKTRLAEIGYRSWYAARLGIDHGGDYGRSEMRAFCPFHKESSTASFQVNVENGLWNCFGACKCGGDVIEFYHRLKGGKNRYDSIYKLALELGVIEEIKDELVEELHQNLFQSEELVDRAALAFGLPAATLKEFQVGVTLQYEKRAGRKVLRYTIPVKGESGHWEDIRKYHPRAEPKILHWAPGHGAPRPFPRASVDNYGTVTWFEGEKDTMRAFSLGIKGAFTMTASAGTIPDGFVSELEGKVLYVCCDVDPAGVEGARKITQAVATYCQELYIVHLPPERLPENGDFSDWCNLGNALSEWKALLASDRTERVCQEQRVFWSPAVTIVSTNGKKPEGEGPEPVAFVDLSRITNARRSVTFVARSIAIGAGMQTFYYPKEVEYRCDQSEEKLCKKCPLGRLPPEQFPVSIKIDLSQEESFQLIQTTSFARRRALLDLMRVPDKCTVIQVQEIERAPTRQVVLTEPLEITAFRTEESQPRLGLYSGEPIQSNRDYRFYGRVQLDPKSQKEVLNLYRAEELQTALESFAVTDEVREAVDWFKPGNLTVSQNLERVLGALERHVGIAGRQDLCRAYCESIFSAARLDVGGRVVVPAVVEPIIVGDAATAKSSMAKRLLEAFKVGQYVDCSTVSVAGLVGGVETINSQRMVKWGVLVQNHLGLVVCDEAHEFTRRFDGDQDVCESLRNIRSNGIAAINKISQGTVPCIVRMIWITNPAKDRATKGFAGAVRSLQLLFPSSADQRRFTKFYAVSVEDVARELSTRAVSQKLTTQEARRYHLLAILTWSLKPEEIRFTLEAIAYLQSEAIRLAQKYDAGIPLLGDDTTYEKLLKLSVPIAVLCGSFQEVEGRLHLVVGIEHALDTVVHLENVYDSKLVGYLDYGVAEREACRLVDRVGTWKHLLTFNGEMAAGARDIAGFLVSHQTFTFAMFRSLFASDLQGRQAFQFLLHQHALRYVNDASGAVYATPEFLDLLREILKGSQ